MKIFEYVFRVIIPLIASVICLVCMICSAFVYDDPAHVWLAYFAAGYVWILIAEDNRKRLDLDS